VAEVGLQAAVVAEERGADVEDGGSSFQNFSVPLTR